MSPWTTASNPSKIQCQDKMLAGRSMLPTELVMIQSQSSLAQVEHTLGIHPSRILAVVSASSHLVAATPTSRALSGIMMPIGVLTVDTPNPTPLNGSPRCQTAGRIPGGLKGQGLVTLKTSLQPGVDPAPLTHSSTAAAWVLRVTTPWLRPCQGLLAICLLESMHEALPRF